MGDDCYVANQGWPGYLISSLGDVLETWSRTRRVMDFAGHSMFCVPVNGNHDGLYGWTREDPKYQYCLDGKIRYMPVPVTHDVEGRFGSFQWGDVLFVWLETVGFCPADPSPLGDAHYLLGADQRSFLQSTLAGSGAAWKFIFSHHLFGGGGYGEDCMEGSYGRGGNMMSTTINTGSKPSWPTTTFRPFSTVMTMSFQ